MSFDRVADIYDSTRALPPGVADSVADRIVAATGADNETRFLEIGIGTGRIGLPLILRGFSYTGVDISQAMMGQLRAKAPNASNLTLLDADVTNLPLPDDSADVALMVHVLHLVPDWRRALDELERVVRPGGFVVEGHNWTRPDRSGDEIRQQWRACMQAQGIELRPPFGKWQAIEEEMIQRNHRASLYRVATWDQHFAPMQILEGFLNRDYSETWDVPDNALGACHEHLLRWANERYGDPNVELTTPAEFVLAVYRLRAREGGV
ncbi:MAG: class I SAM-dependent methyltransferase [Chloroflexota bacterium]